MAKNNKPRFFYGLYSDKPWVFDQSESVPGPICIIIFNHCNDCCFSIIAFFYIDVPSPFIIIILIDMFVSASSGNNFLLQLFHQCTVSLLTLNINKDILYQRFSNTIISSTSVASCILLSSDAQGHVNKSTIRDSCPAYCWFWFSIS